MRTGATAIALAAVIVAGCSSDDDAGSATSLAEVAQVRTVAVPPERLSPFCEALADLEQRLAEAGPDDDTGEMIVSTYSSIVDEVPAEIRDDFLSVLADLQAGTTVAGSTTTTTTVASTVTGSTLEDFEEGYTPDESPALRFNSYVQFTCRDNENNPGPADTQPAAVIESTTPS